MNHQAFSLVYDYADPFVKKILAPLVTEFPIDLFGVNLTFDELLEVKVSITGINLNRFTLNPIPKTVKRISGEGITLKNLPPNLEILKLSASYLDVNCVPESLKQLELTDVTTELTDFCNVDYIYLNNVDFLRPTNSIKLSSKEIMLEHMNGIIYAELSAENIQIYNCSNISSDLKYKIDCETLELYNVTDIIMSDVSCKEFRATKSIISCLPKNVELIDLSECFVLKYEPTNGIKTFIYTGEFSVEMEYPESLKMCKINNVTMFPKI